MKEKEVSGGWIASNVRACVRRDCPWQRPVQGHAGGTMNRILAINGVMFSLTV